MFIRVIISVTIGVGTTVFFCTQAIVVVHVQVPPSLLTVLIVLVICYTHKVSISRDNECCWFLVFLSFPLSLTGDPLGASLPLQQLDMFLLFAGVRDSGSTRNSCRLCEAGVHLHTSLVLRSE